jgi:cobalt-zinc-cadmium efflux system membrane fusion protein
LVPGMYMRATLLDNQHTAAVLPDEAVVHFEDKDYVFVQTKPGAFQLTEVKVGAMAKGLTEIIDGADLQDKDIVVKNAYTLLMQLKNKAEEG